MKNVFSAGKVGGYLKLLRVVFVLNAERQLLFVEYVTESLPRQRTDHVVGRPVSKCVGGPPRKGKETRTHHQRHRRQGATYAPREGARRRAAGVEIKKKVPRRRNAVDSTYFGRTSCTDEFGRKGEEGTTSCSKEVAVIQEAIFEKVLVISALELIRGRGNRK